LARYIGPVCRMCRREGIKLYLKGERCVSKSCAFTRKSYAPGQHGLSSAKKKLSEYGIQMREKQKAKRIYGVLEKQFKNYFIKASKSKGIAGDNLLIMLEKRLDNVIYRLGFARSRTEARQIIRHNFIKVNNHKVNIPSYIVRAGDMIEIKNSSEPIDRFKIILQETSNRIVPEWLSVSNLTGKIINNPEVSQIDTQVNMTLVVELYSK